jgi:hypothetical protein
MPLFRRRAAHLDSTTTAAHAALHAHGGVTAVVSAVALLFSAYSLWETSLKQAELSVHVTGVVTYEHEAPAAFYRDILPAGGYEVFAVPITIANSGARDAAILSLQVDAANRRTGLSARLVGDYTVDGAYFASSGNRRPKTPFSALVVPGRSTWTGTVLFYPVSYSNGKALTPAIEVRKFYDALREKYATELQKADTSGLVNLREKRPDLIELAADLAAGDEYQAKVANSGDKVELTLKLVQPAPSGWLDRLFSTSVEPIALTVNVPDLSKYSMQRGERVRLRRAATRS